MLFNQVLPLSQIAAFIVYIQIVFAHYPVTGVHTGVDTNTGARPPRREILEFQNDLPTWSLYIQALTQLQEAPEDAQLSWLQIAGIHGRPYIPWDNVSRNPNAPKIGYCTHFSVLFATWHRPYLALFEQVLASYVQTIAKTYNSALYQTAADNFRIPYWDWAAVMQLPDVVSQPTVQINTPTGLQTVNNPLYFYQFQQYPLNSAWFPTSGRDVSGIDEDLAQDAITLRFPDQAINGNSQPDQVNDELAGITPTLMEQVWDVFAKSPDYYNMATQISPGPSFEQPHGAVHSAIGGQYGHMSQLSFAGFDPIFWLHHANVDRQIALWQAIYWDTFLLPEVDQVGTFTVPVGTTDKVNSPLTPFYTADGTTPWTSASSRYLSAFGYSYPEIQDWILPPAELSGNVTAQVNALYNPNGSFTKRSSSSRVDRRDIVAQSRAWSVAIQASSGALNGTYVVRLFLGAQPSDGGAWKTAANLIGDFFILEPPSADGQGAADLVFHHEISLQKNLETAGVDIESEDNVVGYLTENLVWGVQKSDGTIVPNAQVPGLQILVQDEIVTLATDITKLPIYGEKTLHPEVTSGKAGGS
ncbi:hypothetical protein B7494_g3943 [Chlorociboria aeruginascens]|nr:hypothetical protein B7494_g3943 [Chlorociboria aeruginascens]